MCNSDLIFYFLSQCTKQGMFNWECYIMIFFLAIVLFYFCVFFPSQILVIKSGGWVISEEWKEAGCETGRMPMRESEKVDYSSALSSKVAAGHAWLSKFILLMIKYNFKV